jgi:hypothetical protein
MLDWSRCDRRFGPLIAERHAGALAAPDAVALERHLARCSDCRSHDQEMGEMLAGMRDAFRAGANDHPSPDVLAALSSGGAGLSAGERARVEAHLASCAECRAEWNVATRFQPVRVAAPARPAAPARWRWFVGGAAAAGVAAALVASLVAPGAPTGLAARPAVEAATAPVQIRGAHHRAAADATPVPLAPTDRVVVVALTVEAAPGAPLAVELRDERADLLATAELSLDDPSGLVTFSVLASRLPQGEGEFRVTVGGSAQTFRYPFRVERRGD